MLPPSVSSLARVNVSFSAHTGLNAVKKSITRTHTHTHTHSTSTYQFAVDGVESLDGSRVELDGVRDITEDLLECVSRFLVEENTDSFARLHSTPDDGHQLGPNEIFVLQRGALATAQ